MDQTKEITLNEYEFIKIEKPSLIVWKRFTKPLFQVVATFEEVSGAKTKIIFKLLFNSADECKKMKVFAGGQKRRKL